MYTTKYPHLAEPLKLGHSGITLKNRVTSAPQWNFMASYDNHITRECVEAVIPFAKGGSSVVAMGSGFINKQLPAACHHVPGMSDPHIVVSLSQWVEAARRWGAKAEIELVPVASYFGTHEVESSVGNPMDIDINILTHDEIKQFIEDYAVAARHAMLAGADIVNVHGAHGQLPALLFNPVFNKRTDEYGAQNFENRCRFAVELLDAIRRECGNKIAIEYRLSCTDIVEGSPEVEEVIEFAKTIQDKIDMLLISRGCLAINKLLPLILPPTYMDHGINIEYAAKFNAALDIPVGVIGAVTFEQAEEAVRECFGGTFGDAGSTVVIEEMLVGPECSLLAFTDGKTVRPMATSQDHKRALEGDKGPNTGGMGVYSPVPIVTDEEHATMIKVMEQTVAELAAEGIDYRGCLYGGFMLTPAGPKVLEFNARFGDPETQVVLPRLKNDLVEVMLACANCELDQIELDWRDEWAVAVVLTSAGYPGSYEKGKVITGIEDAEAMENVTVYHAGTAVVDGQLVTNGGRVLAVTALGDTFENARNLAYEACEKIDFEGKTLRHDIGLRALRGRDAWDA